MEEYVAVRYNGQMYNPANPLERLFLTRLAQTLEKESQWAQAAAVWLAIGRDDEAQYCLIIAKAIAMGDKARAEKV